MQDQRLEWLRPKMDYLFQIKKDLEEQGKNFNIGIQSGREWRNPRICEKLIENCDIKQYGTNLPKEQFDPECWKHKPDSFYNSRRYQKLVDKRDQDRKRKL